jgi:hypothetical protein
MNHIGNDEQPTPDLLTLTTQMLSRMAPATGIAEWSYQMGVQNKTLRPFHTEVVYGHDLVLDWGLIALRIKECSFNPRGGQQYPEIKNYVVRSVELTHEQVADLITAFRPPQQQFDV